MPVVDASVVIDSIAPGVATTAPAVKLLDRLARRSAEIVGPRLLFEEVSNALIMPPSGKAATWEAIHITRVKDGKIVEHWQVQDQLGMLQQLRFIPKPEAVAAR